MPMTRPRSTPGEWAECGKNVEVQIQLFFEEPCLDTCFGDNKGEIKEVYSFGKRSEFPGEFTVGVH
jgi:hypothetical protein